MEFCEKLYHADIGGLPIGDLTLYFCGMRRNAPDHRFGPAARDHYWFIYLREGSGVFTVSGTSHRVTRGCLMAAFPNRRIYYRADPGSIWSIDWVSLDGKALAAYLAMMQLDERSPVLRIASPTQIEAVFDSLMLEAPRETIGSKLAVTSLLYRLLALMMPFGEVVRRDCIDEAVLYMSTAYERPITIAETAAAVNLDRSYFTRLFTKRMGCSPSAWLLDYRVRRACELLSMTELTVSEIAASVGFTDPLYFSRRFSECTGMPPTKWRQSIDSRSDL